MTRLLFPQSAQTGLSISIRKRVPILITMNLFLIMYFVLASLTRYLASPEESRVFFITVNASLSLFLVSLGLVRARRYTAASILSTLAMLFNTVLLGILLPGTGMEIVYRFAVYMLASAVANSMVSIDRRQIPLYAIISIVAYISISLAVYAPRLGGLQGEFRTTFLTTLMLIMAVNIVLLFTNSLSNELVGIAERELELNRQKAEDLAELLNGAKLYMEVGQALLGASEDGQKAGNDIRRELDAIRRDASGLAKDARCADEANTEIVDYSKAMRQAVERQNKALGETTTDIGKIMSIIQNMAALAQDKKRTMDAVIRNVEAQGRHVRMVTDGFDKIREASKKVLGVVSGIMDISEKTNMLAMNASIEAAHAGSAGKGFAVIAQEIRKLSDESRSNTESVQAALVQNDALVRQVSEAAGTFTTEISTINKDVRATFDAMDELISGLSGIASSTRELMSAVTMMVETANEASRDVGAVVDRVGSGSSSVAEISRFSCELENQVDRVGLEFAAIEGALNRIQTIGERNIEQFALFEKDLKAIQT